MKHNYNINNMPTTIATVYCRRVTMRRLTITSLAIIISILASASVASAQSSKGQSTQNLRTANSYSAPSPVTQLRQQQQQQQQQQNSATPQARSTNNQTGVKRRPQQPEPLQQREDLPATATEDPLSDSEPALYGSVAGQPGVDFPAYTRIPKTSFTCEGKGFDFGFYADEEASCQVYHVCWSGRRESFLCGVGTVFNQAILACDYWHSVDCSKSSQFYGVNSELGKAGAEPSAQANSQRQTARTPVILPSVPAVTASGLNYGQPVNQKRTQQQQQIQTQTQTQIQQQQYNSNDDTNFDLPIAQQQVTEVTPQRTSQSSTKTGDRQPASQQQQGSGSYGSSFTPQRSQSYDYQQRVNLNDSPTKTSGQRSQAQAPATTLATPPAKRPRFNMDFNQKVNSLIDSPVRPPIKTLPSSAVKQRQSQQQLLKQQRKQPANFAQLAVSRAQQVGSQTFNAGQAKKSSENTGNHQQQQQTYDSDIDEPQLVQQQQSFDDSPVQTSTAQTATYGAGRQISNLAPPTSSRPNFVQQQTITVQSGGAPDGSSAITTQYDTLNPVSGPTTTVVEQSNYDSGLDDSNQNSSDDFRASGAKAAASHNQNWYIMRSI